MAAPQVRTDPLSGLRVLVAADRADRPHGIAAVAAPPPIDLANDPFAEGNEAMTPPEIWADRPNGGAPDTPGWRVRAVPNKYPALDQTLLGGGAPLDTDAREGASGPRPAAPRLHVAATAHGAHEVIVNDPRPVQALAELSRDELANVLRAWAARLAVYEGGTPYVHLAVNEGVAAGGTLAHTHAQVWTLPFVPELVEHERARARAYRERTAGRNLAEDLLAEEIRAGERLIALDDHAALIAPFAAPSPYRMAVLPRGPEHSFAESAERGAAMLFAALGALTRLFGASPPLNLSLRSAPAGAAPLRWRIEIAPRLAQPAGFELGTGASINAVAPERAAAELRDALRRP